MRCQDVAFGGRPIEGNDVRRLFRSARVTQDVTDKKEHRLARSTRCLKFLVLDLAKHIDRFSHY